MVLDVGQVPMLVIDGWDVCFNGMLGIILCSDVVCTGSLVIVML